MVSFSICKDGKEAGVMDIVSTLLPIVVNLTRDSNPQVFPFDPHAYWNWHMLIHHKQKGPFVVHRGADRSGCSPTLWLNGETHLTHNQLTRQRQHPRGISYWSCSGTFPFSRHVASLLTEYLTVGTTLGQGNGPQVMYRICDTPNDQNGEGQFPHSQGLFPSTTTLLAPSAFSFEALGCCSQHWPTFSHCWTGYNHHKARRFPHINALTEQQNLTHSIFFIPYPSCLIS